MVTLRDLPEPRLDPSGDPRSGTPAETTDATVKTTTGAVQVPPLGYDPAQPGPPPDGTVRNTVTKAMRWYAVAVAALDLAMVFLAGMTALYLRFGVPESEVAGQWAGATFAGVPYTVVTAVLAVVWVTVLAVRGAYTPRNFGAGAEEFKLVIGGSVLAAGLVFIVCYLAQIQLSRGYLALAFPFGAFGMVCCRYAARRWLQWQRRRGRFSHRVLLVGMPAGVAELHEVMRREPKMGMTVVGCCLPRLSKDPGDEVKDNGLPIYGHLDDVRTAVRRAGADTVVVSALPGRSSRLLRRVSWSLEGLGVDLVVVPSLTDVAGPRIHVRPVAGLPLLHVEEPQFKGAKRVVKTVFDWVLAAVFTVLALPVMIAVAIAIKLDDGGPVLLRQTRVGMHGLTFGCWKFRSMVVGAERMLDELRERNGHDGQNGPLFKLRDDPRTTRVGRVIRKLSLDELPQLFNVLRGEMSLVGPRPPLPSEVELYGDDVRRRLLVKPGITGLWQVRARHEPEFDRWVQDDLEYIDRWSLMLDFQILLRTIPAALEGR